MNQMDQMDVDPPSSLPAKHTAVSPSTSPPAGKRAKFLLPDNQLTMLNKNMAGKSNRRKWKMFLSEADNSDDSVWSTLLEDVLMDLTGVLASTKMQASVIASPNRVGAEEIIKCFNKEELEKWKVGVRIGVERNDWSVLLELPKLKIPNIAPTFKLSREEEKATKKSWERTYHGTAAQALWRHIEDHYDPSDEKIYAHFCSIVQSSGMGKSRTVDELGKEHFSIPINLRDAKSTGYPPADHEVRNFLTQNGSEAESHLRACCFIDALFQYTDITLMKFDSQWGIERVAREFRILMTADQTMKEHNKFRRGFYRAVVQLAREKQASNLGLGYTLPMLPKDSPDYAFPPAASCHKLVTSLKRRQRLSSSPVKRKKSKAGPLVILAFDEAHTLTNREETNYAAWSNFSSLRHVFRALSRFPLFSLFLSTTGKISQFTSPDEDTSKRIIAGSLTLTQPFTDIGFDTLARKVTLDQLDRVNGCNLEQVTTDEHIVHLGRPLFGSRYDAGDRSVQEDIVMFAAEKLLNADPNTQTITGDQMLACLSQRLPIEFNSTTYISHVTERKQVEGHLRVCLKIDAAFESMDTLSPSEPLLSEAAYVIMARKSFDPLSSFKSVLEGFAIDKGDGGEFLALLLLTLARDQAVGPPDLKGRPKARFFDFASFIYGHLFREFAPDSELTKLQQAFPSGSKLKQLQQDFPSAKMHFNHFVKQHDFKSIDKQYLLLLMTRGASVLCANSQAAIDTAGAFLPSGMEFTIDNLGLILSQIKNNDAYTHNPKPELFESMDPFKLGILKKGDAAVPLIRIIFALAAKSPGLHVTRHKPSDTYNAIIYDIWSAGLSPDFLKPIGLHADIWDGLLQASYGWKDLYRAREKELRRSENPGAAHDDDHWSCWSVVNTERVNLELMDAK